MTTSTVRRMRIILVWSSVTAMVLFGAGLAGVLGAVGYEQLYANRIFPGVRVLGVRLDGLTKHEAQVAVDRAVDAVLAQGLHFSYEGHDVTIDVVNTAMSDPDATRELIIYRTDQAVEQSFQFGRTGPQIQRTFLQWRSRVAPVHIPVEVALFDDEQIVSSLQSVLEKRLEAPHDARFTYEKGVLATLPERAGAQIDFSIMLRELHARAQTLDFRPIALSTFPVTPKVTIDVLHELQPKAEAFLQRPPVKLTHEKESWVVPSSTPFEWMQVGQSTSGTWDVILNTSQVIADVKAAARSVEVEAKDGALDIQDGKIVSFTAGTEGTMIDAEKLVSRIQAEWPATTTFDLPLIKTFGKLVGEDPEELGIRELLGVGTSNFSGSPTNRRKNIALGIKKVDGSIVMPGETFSLIKTLGPIDEAHKWFAELVIKGNKTTPEQGGGLCQIGTTTFRGALAAGLPIVERRNHSYRVRYYEPAGTDATIYDPKPDFRFLNDTAHAVLVHAYAKGDDIFFEFWGTKDGRVAVSTKPRVYNIVPPAPMKLIETLDLPLGKKKCTETAHAGADAEFTYTVTYPNGEVKKEVFQSHYRPWQAVCLVGVEKLSQSTSTTDGADVIVD